MEYIVKVGSLDSVMFDSSSNMSSTSIGDPELSNKLTEGSLDVRESSADGLNHINVLLGPPLAKQLNVTSEPFSAMMKSGSIVTLLLDDTVNREREREGERKREGEKITNSKCMIVINSITKCYINCSLPVISAGCEKVISLMVGVVTAQRYKPN